MKDERIIEKTRPPGLVQGYRDIWRFREVVWAFTERHIRLKYRQAVLGIAWAIIHPLAFLTIFALVFGRMAGLSEARVAYPLFALSALVPWTFFQTAVTFGSQALIIDGVLVKKAAFAREAPVLGAVLGASLDFAIGLGVLLVLMPLWRAPLSWTMLYVLPLWVALSCLAFGIALGFGAFNVYYRDFRYLMALLLQIWMFATPVVYPIGAVPPQWRTLYVVANPAAGLIDGFRHALAFGQPPNLSLLAISTMGTLVIAWAGYWIFKHLEPGFADAL